MYPQMTVPYESATSGTKARDEIRSTLQRLGCTRLGFMDHFEDRSLELLFEWRGRKVKLRASATGWAAMYLKAHPWSSRTRRTKKEHEDHALDQGLVAINSVLRDWVKGQVTAIETGMMQFDEVFLPYMLTDSGETVAKVIAERGLLPAPDLTPLQLDQLEALVRPSRYGSEDPTEQIALCNQIGEHLQRRWMAVKPGDTTDSRYRISLSIGAVANWRFYWIGVKSERERIRRHDVETKQRLEPCFVSR